MSGVVKLPNNCSAITLGDGAHAVDGNNNVTDASDADFTVLVDPTHKPYLVVAALNGQTTISLPPNVTSITINGNVYAPDGSQQNVVTGPDADMTLFLEQGFEIVDSLS